MKPNSFLILLFALAIISCGEKKEEKETWTNVNCKRIIDSLHIYNTIACYEESGGLLIFEFDSTQKQIARRITFRKGFPLYIDTLSYMNPHKFHSKLLDMTYLIKDTCVVTIHHVKIFHPNSNLQGQSPWIQPYVNTYKRLDK